MLGFLKVFLRGLICTVLLPVILLVWVCYGVYLLAIFVFMLVKSVIVFFKGGSAAGELKEDIESKRMLLEREQEQQNAQQALNVVLQNTLAQMQTQNTVQPAPVAPENFVKEQEQTGETANNFESEQIEENNGEEALVDDGNDQFN